MYVAVSAGSLIQTQSAESMPLVIFNVWITSTVQALVKSVPTMSTLCRLDRHAGLTESVIHETASVLGMLLMLSVALCQCQGA